MDGCFTFETLSIEVKAGNSETNPYFLSPISRKRSSRYSPALMGS